MDIKELKELVKFIEKSGFSEFEFETDNVRLYLSKLSGTPAQTITPQMIQPVYQQTLPQEARTVANEPVKEVEKSEVNPNLIEIKSPIVGTFYEAPAPGAPAFVKEGDIVEKGKTLCIIEAMKIMNEIEAEFDCKIIKRLVKMECLLSMAK